METVEFYLQLVQFSSGGLIGVYFAYVLVQYSCLHITRYHWNERIAEFDEDTNTKMSVADVNIGNAEDNCYDKSNNGTLQ